MDIKAIYKYFPSEPYSNRLHHYLAIYIELPNGKKRWYRASPKIFNALRMTGRIKHEFPFHRLDNCYINIPLTPYFGNGHTAHAGIGVGKILKLEFREMSAHVLCTRSQFVTPEKLKQSVYECYHYLRHDYGKYSHLQIYVDLYNWQKKLKQESNKKAV